MQVNKNKTEQVLGLIILIVLVSTFRENIDKFNLINVNYLEYWFEIHHSLMKLNIEFLENK
jgi:hypothetical protein